jgi:hypothetical protein
MGPRAHGSPRIFGFVRERRIKRANWQISARERPSNTVSEWPVVFAIADELVAVGLLGGSNLI